MFLLRLLSRLPFWFLYLLSDFLFFLIYHVIHYRREMVQKNLRNAFPQFDAEHVKRIEREFYHNMADYAVEMLKLLTISEKEFRNRLKLVNTDLMDRIKGSHESFFGLTSHQFNWEWALAGTILQAPLPLDFVYQPVKIELFERFSLASRTRFGGHAIKRDEVARELFKRRANPKIIGLAADQYPGMDRDKRYATTFLNQETVFFDGTNQLAVLMQYPVLFFNTRKVKRGYYEVTIELLTEPPYAKGDTQVVEKYARKLERAILENPANWLWSHDRWKTRHLKTESAS
ncbi:MAG: lysophospholipid acyltransferase family protein [Cyclobacteriaceae bacterium]|jgi:KDO2-lipid IV(A) lauroyltransferase